MGRYSLFHTSPKVNFWKNPVKIGNDLRLWKASAELSQRLHAGLECRVEDFLDSCPDIAKNSEAAIDLIYEEYAVRTELFQRSLIQELIRRFPQWRRQLEKQFAVHEALVDTVTDQPVVPPFTPDQEKFEIYHEIGRGRASVVFLAWDKRRNHAVAIKVLSTPLLGLSSDLQRQLANEVEILTRLRHPNVVALFEVGEQQGWPYLVLEYVDGLPLSERLEGKPLPVPATVRIALALAKALDQIHCLGAIHCDLSPANILLKLDGEPKIADFGLAQVITHGAKRIRPGTVIGTPSYMAPEQAAGRSHEAGPSSDLYSLGAVLYHMLVGCPPFQGKNAADTLQLVLTQEVPSLRQQVPTIPTSLEMICLKCLEKDPSKRYDEARALARDLRQVLST